MPNFIISGGPGSGKSTLLNALNAVGYNTVGEASRELIQEQVALNSQCLPWVDLPCFARLVLHRMIADYNRTLAQFAGTVTPDRATFFDRGIPDIIAYLRVAGLPVDDAFYQAVRQHPYRPLVFMTPPWEAIYVNDSERWQTFAEATALHDALISTYESLRYMVVPVPLTTVAGRVAFVTQRLSDLKPADTEPPVKTSRSFT